MHRHRSQFSLRLIALELYCLFSLTSALPLLQSAATNELEPKSYSGYQLWRIKPENIDQLRFLEQLWVNDTTYNFDFWQPPRKNLPAEVLVPPEQLASFKAALGELDMIPDVLMFDVQKSIDKKRAGARYSSHSWIQFDDSSQASLTVSQYHSYEEIQNYMRTLQRKFPNLVQLIRIGTTHEGRSIDGIRVTNSLAGPQNKKALWIDAGIHAREWIAPAVAIYFINQLVERYDSNAKSKEMVDNMIWYIVPVLNPDGYEYSRIYDRMWRKNRNPNGRQYSEQCKGVDLNRNFDFFWTGKGSSSNPCKEIYRGDSPFSEPEAQAVRDFVLTHTAELEGFITLHSYSQIWMYPFGHDYNNYPADVNDLRDVALKAAQKVESLYGTHYIVDTGANALYPASGGSDDWSKGKAGIKYVYLIELRPNDYSIHGFLLPESQIVPAGRETWAGIVIVADEILRRNGVTPTSLENTGIRQPFVAGTRVVQQPFVAGRGISGGMSGGQVLGHNGVPGVSLPSVAVAADCVDKEAYCQWWTSLGACFAWREQMKTSCPKSCDFCPSKGNQNGMSVMARTEQRCEDTRQDCLTWIQRRMCYWVEKSCSKSCGFCFSS